MAQDFLKRGNYQTFFARNAYFFGPGLRGYQHRWSDLGRNAILPMATWLRACSASKKDLHSLAGTLARHARSNPVPFTSAVLWE